MSKHVENISKLLERIFLVIMISFMILPFFMMVVTAFKTYAEINDVVNRGILQRILPDNWFNFTNFISIINGTSPLLNGISFLGFIKNSFIITILSLFPALFFAVTAGYGFAKFDFPFKNIMFFMVLGSLMVPMESIGIPFYSIVARAGLVDTYLGIMLPFMISAFGVFMIKQAIESIPNDYIEAARIDGCNEFWILFNIVLPMIKPTVTTVIVIKFLWTWNEYFWPYLVVNDIKLQPITMGLTRFSNNLFQDYGPLTAAVILTIIPTFIIFIFSRRFIVKGISASGIKG
ncbi:L-arabinose transport system permease protein AraQ [subsurface metagenome]